MDGWTIFNLIAGMASIAGGIFSFWQARKSESAAKRVQEIKAQLLTNKETSEVTELLSVHKKAQHSMERFGPGTIPSTLNGITPANETCDVQEFFALLKQHRNLFGQNKPNQADEFCDRLTIALEAFAQAKNDKDLLKTGKDLYILLVDFSPVLKYLMDEKLEKTN